MLNATTKLRLPLSLNVVMGYYLLVTLCRSELDLSAFEV